MNGRDRSRGRLAVRCAGFLSMLLIATTGDGSSRADETRGESADQARLIEGVGRINAPGSPGSLAVFSPTASVVVAGKTGAGADVAVVAAGQLGRGRIVAFAHDGYLGDQARGAADTGKLLLNAARWASGGKAKPRVGLVDGHGLRPLFERHDIPAERTTIDGNLPGFDVLVITPFHVSPPQIGRVREYVRSGGGLLAAATGWGWQQLNGGRPMPEFPGNHLVAGSGLAWSDGFAPTTVHDGYAVEREVSPLANAATALRRLEDRRRPIEPRDLACALENIRLTLRSITAEDRRFREDLRKVMGGMARSDLVPSRRRPIRADDPWRRLAVGLEAAIAQETPAREVRPAAAAVEFPGAVVSTPRRAKHATTIDTAVPGWHGLGLYAAPGEAIDVTIPTSSVPLNLTVQIGSHTDTLWHLDSWERCPEVVRRYAIHRSRTDAANAFGGLIYIDVPEGTPARKVEVAVEGATAAPYYQLGSTSRDEWISTIRRRPAPWAELAGRNLILTVPSRAIRSLDDPEPLMKLWDRIVAAQDAFVSRPERRRPERIVADVQISAGYMHSGYPIMVPDDDSLTAALSEPRIRREGSWGYFHELGHNHQDGAWTFEGTGEVTNNVLVVYVYDRALGLRYDSGHPEIRDPHARAERIRSHMAAGAPFGKWKSDPFLALMMYIQLYEGFGWTPFEKVFTEYRRLSESERPKTDAQKRDQWLVRFSKAAGRNLGPFFQAWGVPTGDKARASIADLPAWMPPGLVARKSR